ncbi:thermostable hemolysin [Pseudonocardia sp. KRD291]|uniref:thermostable hemolysin n=1 Tax=Pseudonocardia sp. KRD291 TaxID=2792007 RepID=UPI001C4A3C34|nr:thermostable hemolysin [Pseudonocardia sp. KRD291]MBW0106567.1 thermostable hemolysin [Pseudonocardia sp. KRD291]
MLLRFARPGTDIWGRCISLVQSRYRSDYGAEIDPDPDLFVMLTAASSVETAEMAVAGLSFGARDSSLFCEHYLGAAAEDVATQVTGSDRTVGRDALIEVGPLASSKAGLGRRMIEVLPGLCWCRGAAAILFTVTRPVASLIRASGTELHVVGDARLEALPADEQPRWGSYYDNEPVVGVVDLARFGAELAVRPSSTSSLSPVGIVAGPIPEGSVHAAV